MSSFAPGTPREVMEEVNRRLYGATTDPKPYNPPAGANMTGVSNMNSLIGSIFGNRMQGGPNQLPSNAVGSVNFGGSGGELPRPIGVGMALPGGPVPGSQVPMGRPESSGGFPGPSIKYGPSAGVGAQLSGGIRPGAQPPMGPAESSGGFPSPGFSTPMGPFGGPAQSSGGFPGRLDDILRAIGVPPTTPPTKQQPTGTQPYIPGFLGMPMPSSPQGPLPDISTMLPELPPQMPVAGMTPAPTPPQMPIRAVEDPYSTTPDLSPGMQQRPAQGMDMQKLMAALRNMQTGNIPQPFQPPNIDALISPSRMSGFSGPGAPMRVDQQPGMAQARSGQLFDRLPPSIDPARLEELNRTQSMQRPSQMPSQMPSPTPTPQSQMGGRSAMGLGGLLGMLRAQRRR